jgi:methylenetetrahydrofolate dehydrogenase (NADP+)/methenyltetrahydrofolate cyclohydrolase
VLDKILGDYDEKSIAPIAKYYTPTPGGMGPINVACLLQNLVTAIKGK